MYKIYIKETPLLLVDVSIGFPMLPGSENCPVALYTGKSRQLLNFIDLMEKNDELQQVTIFHSDPAKLFEDLKSLFICLEAAGGLVLEPEGELLAIYRRQMWDLPKGKLETGESPESGALREVEEETGVVHLQIDSFITETYHIYKEKGKRILKKTYWYKMFAPKQALIPQTEEDIQEAVWIKPDKFTPDHYPTYQTILEVLQKGLYNTPAEGD